MQLKLRVLWTRWYWTLATAIVIALMGAGSAWWQDSRQSSPKVRSAYSLLANPQAGPRIVPDSFQSHAGFITGANGPLESPGRKAARLANEARAATRRLVKPDRSNVDCTQMKCIALTYDDGPEPGQTQQLLDILDDRQVVATFFVLGSRVAAQSDTLKQAVKGRNEIGNHTWSHRDLKALNDQEIADELRHANEAIAQAIGRQPRLVRPPMGEYDDRVAAAAGMPLALWTVDPRDWRDRDAELIYQRVMHRAERGRVILLHDTYPTTIQASSRIIDELQRQGYVLVTMSELFGITDANAAHFAGKILRHN